ncbi:hypothetical protein ACFL02_06080 [Planctomycetota bacterium]
MKRYRQIGFSAAAAAVLIVVLILGWPGPDDSGSAQANMADVTQVLQNAKTLHIKGWDHIGGADPAGQDTATEPWEYWCDLEMGCYRRVSANVSSSITMSTGSSAPQRTRTINRSETVCDGQYIMTVNHARKTVRYARLNEIHYLLERNRRSYEQQLNEVYGDSELLDTYQMVGAEVVNGVDCEIWQGERSVQSGPFGGIRKTRFQSWVASVSGDLMKVRTWRKSADTDWVPAKEYYLFERDIVIDPAVFSTEPPAGYRLLISKADAPLERFASSAMRQSAGELTSYFNFKFGDAALLCFGSRDAYGNEPATKIFEQLEPAGPLPVLPITIYGLKQTDPAGEVTTYSGCHLAYTCQNGQFYEWALYRPDNPQKPFNEKSGFEYITDPPPHNQMGNLQVSGGMLTNFGMEIKDKEHFNKVVRGLMALLSDSGAAPDYVTYEYLLQLLK